MAAIMRVRERGDEVSSLLVWTNRGLGLPLPCPVRIVATKEHPVQLTRTTSSSQLRWD
jgi:hypothetical protein